MQGFDRPGQRSWCEPESTGWNRVPAHSPLIPFPDRDGALAGVREKSPWFLSLDGEWRFRLCPRPEAVPADFADPALDDDGWSRVEVPGNWTRQGFDRPHYTNVQMPFPEAPPDVPDRNPTGLYRRRFTLPEGWEDRRVVLHFGGAESVLYVFVNGVAVGFGKDSRLPQEFDVTSWLRPGENTVAAAVVRFSDASFLEDQDHWWMAGLHREVHLVATGRTWLADVHATADFEPDTGAGHLRIRGALGSLDAAPDDWTLVAELLDPKGRARLREPLRGRIAHRGNPYAFRGDQVVLEARLPRVRPWSAERPDLYGLLVSLEDAQGHTREVAALRVGFRRVEVRDRALLVNGRRVPIRGVNRHDHDERRGKAVSRDAMRLDVVAMKRLHFNAVRTAHYPNDPFFYELCDELGLYVVDEANAESHAFLRSLSDDARYTRAFFERAERMVRRDKNHASIIAWSLGNESGYGTAHGAMAGFIRRYDPTRPLHYEGALEFRLETDRLATDLICPMYASVDQITRWARTTRDDRPLVLCEYAHSMGNSTGGLLEYFQAFERHRGLQGGFIWDWMDQGLLEHDAQGRPFWAYGGDFGDEPNDENFCINGLVWPDRTPHPAALEHRKLAQPVAVEARDLRRGRLRVRNRQVFTDLSWLRGRFEVTVDGRVAQRGRLPVLRTPPGEAGDVTLPLRAPQLAPGQEAWLTVRFETARELPWAPRGFEVAWEQLALPHRARAAARPQAVDGGLEVETVDGAAVVRGEGFDATFDLGAGVLRSLRHGGVELLAAAPRLQLWRAPTDDDLRSIVHLREPGAVRWVDLGLECVETEAVEVARRRSREGGFALSVLRRLRVGSGGAPVEQRSEWRVGPAGDLLARERIRVDPALPELARVGVCFSVAPGFEALRWLGRGPHESYADRKAGAALGLWSGSVDEQLVPYVRPQENGNKTDVRWFTLERPGGPGLLVTAERPFEFSALHATAADLHRARHPNELERRPEVVVNLDARQRGLGTGACGPDTLPAYRIGPGLHRFAWRLRPYDPRREALGALARQAFPAGGGAGGARRRGPARAGRRER